MRKRVSKLIALGCLGLSLCFSAPAALAQETVQDAIREASNEVRQIELCRYIKPIVIIINWDVMDLK